MLQAIALGAKFSPPHQPWINLVSWKHLSSHAYWRTMITSELHSGPERTSIRLVSNPCGHHFIFYVLSVCHKLYARQCDHNSRCMFNQPSHCSASPLEIGSGRLDSGKWYIFISWNRTHTNKVYSPNYDPRKTMPHKLDWSHLSKGSKSRGNSTTIFHLTDWIQLGVNE